MITTYLLIGVLWALYAAFQYEDEEEETLIDFVLSVLFWPAEVYWTLTQDDDDDFR